MNLKRNLFFFMTVLFFGSQVIIFMRYESGTHPPAATKIKDGVVPHPSKDKDKPKPEKGPERTTEEFRLEDIKPVKPIINSQQDEKWMNQHKGNSSPRPRMWWSRARGIGGGSADTWFVTGTDYPGDLEEPIIETCRKNATTICLGDERVAYVEEWRYPVWVLDLPPFVNEGYRKDFLGMQQVREYMTKFNGKNCPAALCGGPGGGPGGVPRPANQSLTFYRPQFSKGQLVVIEDGVYAGRPDGGWMPDTGCETGANYKVLEATPKSKASTSHDKLVLFIGPQSSSFQHFIDRLLPDVAQAWDLVVRDKFQLLMENNNAGNVGEMWKHLNSQLDPSVREVVSLQSSRKVHASQMLFACNVPRYHPVIWRKIQRMFGVQGEVSPRERDVVMYLSRPHSRKVLNEKKLLEGITSLLKKKNEEENRAYTLEIFDKSKFKTFEETRDYFNFKVRAVLGPHGGAFYNINFCPRETLVIEFFPFTRGVGNDNNGIRWPEGTWWQSAALGQNYWQMPFQTASGGDINVNVGDVLSVLDTELKD